MNGHRTAVGRVILGSAVAIAVHGLLLRPHLLTWGATRGEAERAYPGDELVPDANSMSTMASTLPGPPAKVWPWLAQMGHDRAGWYSWDWLDNGGRPSADRLVPWWQHPAVGQRLNSTSGGRSWFTVAELVPERTLVLRADLRLPSGRPFDPAEGPAPRAFVSSIWSFHLEPADAGTRLVVRTRGRSRPRLLTGPLDLLFWEPAHLVMQTRQFHNLRARVRPAR
ncbi:hypothetical protein [Kitasatospora sp. MBT63]|uniref:hypothetical protein n=1 Tax=Kitasatospora sp. MBT63 TaxID=1444768 RepID=UPI00053AAE3B|nr:hypothetical protein [Kitasatospora sp. MBT63]